MTTHEKLLVAEFLLVTALLSASGLAPRTQAPPSPVARTVPIELGGPALGVSWTGSLSIDESGAMSLRKEPGLQWESDDDGLLAVTRRALRILRSLVEGPPRLATGAVPRLNRQGS